MEYILNITDWNVNLYWHNVLIIGNWTRSQVCSIMLVKTTQYKSSGISSANLLRALEILDLPPASSPELNKCPGSNPVASVLVVFSISHDEIFLNSIIVILADGQWNSVFRFSRLRLFVLSNQDSVFRNVGLNHNQNGAFVIYSKT